MKCATKCLNDICRPLATCSSPPTPSSFHPPLTAETPLKHRDAFCTLVSGLFLMLWVKTPQGIYLFGQLIVVPTDGQLTDGQNVCASNCVHVPWPGRHHFVVALRIFIYIYLLARLCLGTKLMSWFGLLSIDSANNFYIFQKQLWQLFRNSFVITLMCILYDYEGSWLSGLGHI